jgi:hypothetical protein
MEEKKEGEHGGSKRKKAFYERGPPGELSFVKKRKEI